MELPHERGEHDEDCGYKETVEGHLCGFICGECSKESEQVSGNDLPEQELPETNIEKSEETAVFVLTAFEMLGEKTQYQTVSAGTKLSELDLPNTLSASGYPLENDAEHVSEPVTITDVVWESDTEYDENAGQGSYLFTPVLPTGYTCEKDVELPEIYVRIGVTNVVLDMQDDVLNVTFNSNGSGGNSMDDNEMKKAIDAALNGKTEASITIIKLTGSVGEITRYNWKYLLERYAKNSDWDKLTTLDLSGMTGLETMMNDTSLVSSDIQKMKMLYLPDGLKQIGKYTFWGCSNLELQELPDSLTQIGRYAFYGCTSLALQSLPDNLTQIENSAFYGCTSLALQSLPEDLTRIEDSVFYDCASLALQSLPKNLTQIGDYAFYGCTGLSSIIMESSTAPTISSTTFKNTNTGLTFYVPKNKTGYHDGNWAGLKTVEYTPTASLTLNRNTLQLELNKSETLIATLFPADAVPIVLWESSDTGIVKVDGSGRVTAVSLGTATITATSRQGGKKDTCAVTVNTPTPGGGDEQSSSSGSVSNITITPPKPPQPDSPERTVVETPVTVKDGMATGTASDDSTWEALARALHTARQKGREKYGIAMQYSVTSAAVYDSFSIIIKRATLDRLADPDNGIKYLTLHTPIVDLTFDLAALQEIQKQSTGDITLTAARETGLTGDMLAAVGTRPAYRLTVGYTGQDGTAAFVTSFGAGRVTVRLAYKPAADEQTGSLFLVYSKDGKTRNGCTSPAMTWAAGT